MEIKDSNNKDLKQLKPQDFTPDEIKKISSFLISLLGYNPVKRPKINSLLDAIKKI